MRPIKVAFKDTHFKYRFMKRLRELKQHKKYDNVSITNDLTKLEREQVKEWRKKANEINQAMSEKDHVLRVSLLNYVGYVGIVGPWVRGFVPSWVTWV